MVEEALIPRIWLRRFAALALLALVLWLASKLTVVAMPFLLAWIAAYLVSPAVDWLEERRRWKRDRAVLLIMGLAALVFLLLLAFTIPVVINESLFLSREIPVYQSKVMAEIDYWQQEGRLSPMARELAHQALLQLEAAAPQIVAMAGENLFSWLGSLMDIFNFLLDVCLFLFVFYYFLCDFHVVNGQLVAAVPERYRPDMREWLNEIDASLRTVIRGQFIVAVAMAGCYTVGLMLVGVPYALLIGLVAGFGNFLPYVGPLFGLAPALAFTALHHTGSLGDLGILIAEVVAVFVVVQVLESYFLTPKLAGESVGLGPVAVLFAVSVGGALLGLAGVIVALPLAAVIKVVLQRAWQGWRDSKFYQAEKAEPPASS